MSWYDRDLSSVLRLIRSASLSNPTPLLSIGSFERKGFGSIPATWKDGVWPFDARAPMRRTCAPRTLRASRTTTRCACRFNSNRKVSVPLRRVDEEFSARAYLRDSERVVHITFPDERRKRRVGDGKWHVRLLPMQLLWVEFCAVCVIHAWYDDERGGLRLAVSDLDLEGVPKEFGVAETLHLEVDGQLVARSTSPRTGVLDGKIHMQLTAPHLPAALEFAPGFQDVVQGILDSVLERLERSIVREIGRDYGRWVLERRSQSTDSIDQGQQVTLLSGGDGG